MWSVVSLLALAAALAGCEQSQATSASAGASRPPEKLAAKVNGTLISVQQVAGGGAAAGGAASTNPAQALEKIIDRELLVQKALQAKLDRDPQVMQALDNSRRQMLAQAYLERAAAAAVKSTPDEVSAFYSENPALFAHRRIYRLREMAVSAPADKLELIRSEAAGAKDLEEVAGWLKWRNLKVGAITGTTQAAEQLPLGYLPPLARMREGEIAVLASAPGATVIQLVQAQDAPLTEQQAAPLIEQFIAGRKRLELAAAEVRRLREVASIEYVGDFKR